MAYDPLRGRTVLFGGDSLGWLQTDTWEWDGTVWIQRQPAHRPSPRLGMQMHYVPDLRACLLFGGRDYASCGFTEQWLWDGSDWNLQPSQLPTGCTNSTYYPLASAYDSARREVVAFYDFLNGGIKPESSQWHFSAETLAASLYHPRPGESLLLDLGLSQRPQAFFLLALSQATHPGIAVRGGVLGPEVWPLAPDRLWSLSLGFGLSGLLDAGGAARVRLALPPDPALAYQDFHAAAITLGFNPFQVTDITNNVWIRPVR